MGSTGSKPTSFEVREVYNRALWVDTPAGHVLVNSPPETLKHLFAKNLPVPQTIILPPDIEAGQEPGSSGFVRQGINYASVEFFLYYNFFVQGGKKTRLITITEDQAQRIKSVLVEAIFGPFAHLPADQYRWLASECDLVSIHEPLGRSPTVDDLTEIRSLERHGGDLGAGVSVRFDGVAYHFGHFGKEVLRVSAEISGTAIPLTLAPPTPLLRQEITLQFVGSSDGFDPNGITTCFLAYFGAEQNTSATLFDTAAYLRIRLGNLGISSRQISEVVLTHMHEDHVAGMPELLLMGERRLRLLTSDVVYGSFLRSMAAIMAIPEDEVASLIDFYPLNPGVPLELEGRRFETIYAVHSIPTLAVRVNGLCYSGDMVYDETWFGELEEEGVLSSERRMELTNFANDAVVLVQDVGGGTIHTTLTSEVFKSLAAKSKHLILAHTSSPDALSQAMEEAGADLFTNVQFASAGLVTAVGEAIENDESSERLETITASPLFARLPLEKRIHLAEFAHIVQFAPGEVMMDHGDHFDGKTYIVHSGLVEVRVDGAMILVMGRGSSVGERGALRGDPRTATVIARGAVQMLLLDAEYFNWAAKLLKLNEAFARAEWLWKHSNFGVLSWATLLDMALDFQPKMFTPGEYLFQPDDIAQFGFLLISGEVRLLDGANVVKMIDTPGAFLGGKVALYSQLHKLHARAVEPTVVWALHTSALQRLQMVYPNVILQLRLGDEG